jgi:hypothetical protein
MQKYRGFFLLKRQVHLADLVVFVLCATRHALCFLRRAVNFLLLKTLKNDSNGES